MLKLITYKETVTSQEISARDEREAGIGKIIQERDATLLNEAMRLLFA